MRSTGRWWASISSRSRSGTSGRSSPLRWRILLSLSTPTTSTSPSSFAFARYFTCPRWMRSNDPEVSTMRWPSPRRFATRSAMASRDGTSRSSKLTPGPRMPLVIATPLALPRPRAHAELDRPRRGGLQHHEMHVQVCHAPSVVAHVPAALDRCDGDRIEAVTKCALESPQVGAGLVGKLVERRHVRVRHDQVMGARALVRVVVLHDVPVRARQLDGRPVLLRAEDADAGRLELVHVAALLVGARRGKVVQGVSRHGHTRGRRSYGRSR